VLALLSIVSGTQNDAAAVRHSVAHHFTAASHNQSSVSVTTAAAAAETGATMKHDEQVHDGECDTNCVQVNGEVVIAWTCPITIGVVPRRLGPGGFRRVTVAGHEEPTHVDAKHCGISVSHCCCLLFVSTDAAAVKLWLTKRLWDESV